MCTFAAVNNEQRFIKKVMNLFMRLGIKSLTMDDIARQLGISKKTIYKYVSDKNELVRKCVEWQSEEEYCAIAETQKAGLNAIDEIFEISKMVTELLSQLHPSVYFDLEKYYPEAWDIAVNKRKKRVYEDVVLNMNKGVQEGLYRSDLNVDVVARIYVAKMDLLFDGNLFPPHQFSFTDVYIEFFRYHIRGIASEKGREYLTKKMTNEHLI